MRPRLLRIAECPRASADMATLPRPYCYVAYASLLLVLGCDDDGMMMMKMMMRRAMVI